MKKSELRKIIKEELQILTEINNKTFKYVTPHGTVHIEIEEDPGGLFIDVIVNKQELVEVNVEAPSGIIKIKQKKSRIPLK